MRRRSCSLEHAIPSHKLWVHLVFRLVDALPGIRWIASQPVALLVA